MGTEPERDRQHSPTSDPATAVPTFTAPSDPTVLTFTLAITDSLGLPAPTPDEVVVIVEGYRIYLPLVLKQDESSAVQTGRTRQRTPMQASLASAGGWPWLIPSVGPPLSLGLVALWKKRQFKECV